jgi:group I intron endonuclease
MDSGVIYVATNTVTGSQYVGLTRMGVAVRWAQHVAKSKNPKTHFHRAIAKHGSAAFDVAEYASAICQDFLASLERDVILQLSPAYNQTGGGEVTFGRKYDDAAKEKIRLANIGRNWTAEQKQRMSDLKCAQYVADPELAKASAERLKEARHLGESVRVVSVKESSKNRVWSVESKAKLSASCMGRKYGKDIITKMAASKKRKVFCVQTGAVYDCAADAAAVISAHKASVSAACKHGRKVYGFNFKHLE